MGSTFPYFPGNPNEADLGNRGLRCVHFPYSAGISGSTDNDIL
jgi:hypothetical protein